MNQKYYMIGYNGKIPCTDKDLSLKIVNLEIIKRFFSNLRVEPTVDVDDVVKKLTNGGKVFVKTALGSYKIMSFDWIKAAKCDWTLKGDDLTLN